ncbi:MAG: hypothetical protein WCK58_06165 [Chloroflexota bacterium]
MMRATIRLTLKQHRLVVTLFVAGMLLSALASFLATWLIGWIYTQPDVIACASGQVLTEACERTWTILMAVISVGQVGGIAPAWIALAAGLLLGVPLVGDEIEKGTAVLAWTLAPTRRGWLLRRVVVLGFVLLACSLLTAVSSDTILQATNAQAPIGRTFIDVPGHGWMIPFWAMAAFAAGTLAGALLGRLLPALIAGGAFAGILILGTLAWGTAELYNSPTVEIAAADTGAHVSDWRYIEPATGRMLSNQDLYDTYGDAGWELSQDWQQVQYGVPGELAPLFVARELCVLTVGITILLGAGFVVVERRRPY